ncbi:hypothetical protein HOY82DRAFT_652079 [Tuber indicum]|nr:hypothetical protein HOY82DRAFT_652079 [Tuber indicum]
MTHHNTQTIKASGDRLLEEHCKGAYVREGQCKIVSLPHLETLFRLAADEGSSYVIDTLMGQKFIVVIIDSLKWIGAVTGDMIIFLKGESFRKVLLVSWTLKSRLRIQCITRTSTSSKCPSRPDGGEKSE